MIEWSETQLMIRDAVRDFCEKEIAPNLDTLEHGDTPPYAVLRKMVTTFGMDEMARDGFHKTIAAEKAGTAKPTKDDDDSLEAVVKRADKAAMTMLPVIELSRYCPGMVTALGVSQGLAAGTIMSKGTIAQKERWALPLLTLEKIGSWAITEPNSGSDAFGGMKATAKRTDDGGYILNGNKTYITNGPYADTIIFICKLDEPGVEPKQRKILNFILDSGMEGLVQSKPFNKMGIHSSPTGELFLQDVKVGPERLVGETEDGSGRSGAKDTFSAERAGVCDTVVGVEVAGACSGAAAAAAPAARLPRMPVAATNAPGRRAWPRRRRQLAQAPRAPRLQSQRRPHSQVAGHMRTGARPQRAPHR